ncbi:pectate lyase [Hymenopellis radicata]|nr:pectate lyase [Hymenopellis radicata]
MRLLLALAISSLAGLASACDAYTAVIEIAAGETFDGGWKKYDRGSGACNGQSEGDWEDAVFYLHEGATLQNVIIVLIKPKASVDCTLNFVEDAISIKNDKAGDYTNIIGGGVFHADDKIVQHNGCGTVNVRCPEDYGKLYRSCGNCKSQCQRNVYISGVEAREGGALAGINSNYADTATIIDACYDTSHPCVLYDGCAGG